MDNIVDELVKASVGALAYGAMAQLLPSSPIPGLLLVVLLIIIFLWTIRSRRYPFDKYYLTQEEMMVVSLSRIAQADASEQPEEFTCGDRLTHVFGPYLRVPLRKGKYRAAFRLKTAVKAPINSLRNSMSCHASPKSLDFEYSLRMNFGSASHIWQFCRIDFATEQDEPEVEFRVTCMESGDTLTLDYVRLTRRLL